MQRAAVDFVSYPELLIVLEASLSLQREWMLEGEKEGGGSGRRVEGEVEKSQRDKRKYTNLLLRL